LARKILLADDSVTAQNMGRKILADAGYEVITVNNGSAALKKIAEQKPDLIVLDVYMPGYSGLEVCQRLKEAGDTSRIPILLTVGKLEPFKPEEARRVRADGFIVKPFEASELLSALSKLEDRVVPRSESSKPGRFARATAAIDEGRYDKTVAPEEDSGWKSRIVFPKKKEKEKAPEADVDDPSIYNPVNKDLRTVIEHKATEHKPVTPAETEEERVNLSALAPEGLPKDVTPEEIAALAAAAAQVKGKIAEEKPAEPIAEMAVVAPVEDAAQKPESKEEIRSAEPVTSPAEIATPAEPAVTLAEQSKTDETETKSPEFAASPSEVMAAIVGLEQQSTSAESASSGNGSWSHSTSGDEPVTMAVAAAAGAGSPSSRWTAVAVALAPDEAAISLEHEMQKAYAAFAASENAHSQVASAVSEPAPAPAPTIESTAPVSEPASAPTTETAPIEIPPTPTHEAASSFAEIATAAKEAVTAAVTELASVAASYLGKESPAEPASQPASETASAPLSESTPAPETVSAVEAKEAPKEREEQQLAAAEGSKTPEESTEAKVPEATASSTHEEQVAEETKEPAAHVAEVSASSATSEVSEVQASSKEAVSEGAALDSVRPTAGGTDEMAKKESEVNAAWASWRRIRESRDSKPGADESDEVSPKDEAAMAVAVGAESSPEDVASNPDSDPEIASIVDSVLADMRPRIVEEIARKLGKKK